MINVLFFGIVDEVRKAYRIVAGILQVFVLVRIFESGD